MISKPDDASTHTRARADPAGRDFPPLTVPLVGLAPDPAISARWVSFVAGKIGEPAEGVVLDHRYPSPETKLQVENLPRHQYDKVWAAWDVPTTVAFAALLTLTGFTRPSPGMNVDNGRVMTYIEENSERWQKWPSAQIHLHGTAVACPVARFAGSWVALVEDDPQSHLIVLGRGLEPTDIELVRITTDAYGFDPDNPTPTGPPGPERGDTIYPTELTPVHPDWAPFVDHGPVRAYPGEPCP